MKMAGHGHGELDQFMRKFVSLLKSGCEASLHLESKAGKAFVNLRLGLGQVQSQPGAAQHVGGHRGGGPSKQRRRDRREAQREAKGTAAKAEAAENAPESDSAESEFVGEDLTEEVILGDKIPQVDGVLDLDKSEKTSCEMLEYELTIEAHEKCKNYDVIENIEVNFDGILNDMKIEENDTCCYILVQKLEKELQNDNEAKKTLVYRVFVRNCKAAQEVVESWKIRYNFDDLAFRSAVYGVVNVRILEVKNL